MRNSSIIRFAGSLGLALCIVVAMLWLGLEVSGFAEGDSPRVLETHDVTLLSESERLDLQALLGEGRYGLVAPSVPDRVGTPSPRAAERGFVRLDVLVDESGAVADVRVIDAEPPGVYEAQAVAEIRRKRYSPDVVDGAAVTSRHLEIVDFAVSPAIEAHAGRE